MTPQYLPIAAECGLYLRKNGHGDDNRFARMFRHVWRSVATNDRDAIVAHWSNSVSVDEGRLNLSIALENLSRLREAQAIGDCATGGTDLKFYARVIDMLPDDLVKYVIAHELAHVLQVSRGQELRPGDHPFGDAVAYALSPVEKEADDIAQGWGFDGTKLNNWLHRRVSWDSLPKDMY